MNRLYKFTSILTSVVFLLLFIQLFFASNSFMSDLGLEPSVTSLVLARRVSMFMLGLAVLMFLSRNSAASKERMFVCISNSTLLLGLVCMGGYEFFKGTVNSSIFVAITIESVLLILYSVVMFSDVKTVGKCE
jgi:uncharacterized membrane protein